MPATVELRVSSRWRIVKVVDPGVDVLVMIQRVLGRHDRFLQQVVGVRS